MQLSSASSPCNQFRDTVAAAGRSVSQALHVLDAGEPSPGAPEPTAAGEARRHAAEGASLLGVALDCFVPGALLRDAGHALNAVEDAIALLDAGRVGNRIETERALHAASAWIESAIGGA